MTSAATGRSSDARDGHASPTHPGSPSSSGSGNGSGSSSNSGGSPSRFTASPGVAAHIKDLSPVDCFLQLFDQRTLELLHTETLRYLEQYLEDKEYSDEHPNARVHDLERHPITLEDMKALIAILIGMGICGFPSIR